MKTKTVCEKCQTRTYTFESFYFIAFNLNLLQTKINNMNQISIYDCFTFQNNTLMKLPLNKLVNCRKCQKLRPHLQRKQFYKFPKFLIICLDRGIDCQNQMKLFYPMNLSLKGNADDPESPLNYNLSGVVKRMDKNGKEHYV